MAGALELLDRDVAVTVVPTAADPRITELAAPVGATLPPPFERGAASACSPGASTPSSAPTRATASAAPRSSPHRPAPRPSCSTPARRRGPRRPRDLRRRRRCRSARRGADRRARPGDRRPVRRPCAARATPPTPRAARRGDADAQIGPYVVPDDARPCSSSRPRRRRTTATPARCACSACWRCAARAAHHDGRPRRGPRALRQRPRGAGIEVYAGDPDVPAIAAARRLRPGDAHAVPVAEAISRRSAGARPRRGHRRHGRPAPRARAARRRAAATPRCSRRRRDPRRERMSTAAPTGSSPSSEDERAALEAFAPGVPVGVVSNIHGAEPTGDGFDGRDGLLFVAGFGPRRTSTPRCGSATKSCRSSAASWPTPRVRIVGSNPPAEIRALAGDSVEVTGWVPRTDAVSPGSRLSIAPLRYGAGVKGKSARRCPRPARRHHVDRHRGHGPRGRRGPPRRRRRGGFADAVVRAYRDPSCGSGCATPGAPAPRALLPAPAAAGGARSPRASERRDLRRRAAGLRPGGVGDRPRLLPRGVHADDPVSLVVALDEPRRCSRVADLIGELGHDPLRSPT